MPPSKFSISWNSYKNNICAGFSTLQQQEEFVDMTLAAEGHFVKVHKNLIALASPYLKQILQSAPCQHPVIFLSHISQKVLSYILEYIYTGEVQVSIDDMNSFIEACKSLHIAGVENILPIKNLSNICKPSNKVEIVNTQEPSIQNNFAAHITINNGNQLDVQNFVNDRQVINNDERMIQIGVNNNNSDFNIGNNCTAEVINKPIIEFPIQPNNELELIQDLPSLDESDCILDNSNNDDFQYNNISTNQVQTFDDPSVILYSMSNRGSLQLIFKKYIYNTHHKSHEGLKRRWRCIDYRKLKCPAFIDTDGDFIVNREVSHNHHRHDNNIFKKSKQNLIFTSAKAAEKAVSDKVDLNTRGTVMDYSE